ncbi:MAG: indole-3-glycerol phosphate synthase TrpC [bacterium]
MILDRIVKATEKRVSEQKKLVSALSMKSQALALPVKKDFPFQAALDAPELSFICEVKKASPSKGVIAEDFPYLTIAQEYEKAGAAAVSVLTEPDFFQGSGKYLREISRLISLPVLRKDFIIDEYQIYEAKCLGASAVLLIAAILEEKQLQSFLELAHSLGLSALVEAHTEEEADKALKAGAKIIGVNNRNLQTFEVDLNNSLNLRRLVPPEISFVAESGIKSADDIKKLTEAGVNGVLIGETLMRSPDKKAALDELKGKNHG